MNRPSPTPQPRRYETSWLVSVVCPTELIKIIIDNNVLIYIRTNDK